MNNKDLKNRLKSEIESITPRVYDNVVQSSYIEKPVVKTKKAGASKAFRIATSAVACVLIMAIAITCGVLFAPKKDNSPISNYYYVQVSAGADKATAAADEKTDGAKITLTLNSEETVETVRAENMDGDMILHLSGELKGLKFDVATRKSTKPRGRSNSSMTRTGFPFPSPARPPKALQNGFERRLTFRCR